MDDEEHFTVIQVETPEVVIVPVTEGPIGPPGPVGPPGAAGDGATDPGDLTLLFDNKLI